MALIGDFLTKIQAIHATGEATEHSYRSAIEFLFSGLDENTTALNEPNEMSRAGDSRWQKCRCVVWLAPIF